MNRVAIIGSSGHYGQAMIRELRRSHPNAKLLGLDVVDAAENAEPDEFRKCDVRSPETQQALIDFEPDTILHFAFIVDPIRDDARMHDVNVNGAKNVLEATTKIQPRRLLMASSATAYGAWPDNPVPMPETQPVRGRPEYRYSKDKDQIESMLVEFARQNPNIKVSCTRPAIIYEEGVKNYLTTFISTGPLIVLPSGNDTEMQFVHSDDVVAATRLILENNAEGAFNIGPNDWLTLSDMAKMSNRSVIKLPFAVCKMITTLWWGLRLPLYKFPPSLWYFIRFPWIVEPRRLTQELGYEFKFSSRETLQQMFDHTRRKR